MWDNGAFSAYTKGAKFDERGYINFLEDKLFHPHWAVIPDVIGGTDEENLEMISRWPYGNFGAPVWHLDRGIEYLLRLAENSNRVCFGSSGEYWKIGTDGWNRRIDLAFNSLESRGLKPWVHMLRAMDAASCGPWPFGSADSTNIARNHARNKICAACMSKRIEAKNPNFRLAPAAPHWFVDLVA